MLISCESLWQIAMCLFYSEWNPRYKPQKLGSERQDDRQLLDVYNSCSIHLLEIDTCDNHHWYRMRCSTQNLKTKGPKMGWHLGKTTHDPSFSRNSGAVVYQQLWCAVLVGWLKTLRQVVVLVHSWCHMSSSCGWVTGTQCTPTKLLLPYQRA